MYLAFDILSLSKVNIDSYFLYKYNPIFDTLLLKKACYPLELHGLQAFVVCIDMCYFLVFVPVECFVSLIILLIFAFEMNS